MILLQLQDFLQEAADSFAGLRGLEAGIGMPGVFERLEDYFLRSDNAAIDFGEAFTLYIGNNIVQASVLQIQRRGAFCNVIQR